MLNPLVPLVISTYLFASGAFAADALPPWSTLNGFSAGMQKVAAKANGYGECAFGKAAGESSESVYCEIPAAKRAFLGLQVTAAKLEFKPPKLDQVHEIHIRVEGRQDELMKKLVDAFGAPYDTGRFYVWVKDTPHTLSIAKRQLVHSASMYFKYEPGVLAAVRKQVQGDKSRTETLKTF